MQQQQQRYINLNPYYDNYPTLAPQPAKKPKKKHQVKHQGAYDRRYSAAEIKQIRSNNFWGGVFLCVVVFTFLMWLASFAEV